MPFRDGKAQLGARDLLKQEAQVAAMLRRFPWLLRWRESSVRRTLESRMASQRLHAIRSPQQSLWPAWQHAGLPDEPVAEVALVENGRDIASAYLSAQSSKLLLLSIHDAHSLFVGKQAFLSRADGAKSETTRNPSFRWGSGSYVAVNRLGKWTRRVVGKDDP